LCLCCALIRNSVLKHFGGFELSKAISRLHARPAGRRARRLDSRRPGGSDRACGCALAGNSGATIAARSTAQLGKKLQRLFDRLEKLAAEAKALVGSAKLS